MNIYRIMQTFQEQQAAILELESKLKLQPCGHPRFCDRVGEEVAPGQFVHTCAWCASLAVARWQAAREGRVEFEEKHTEFESLRGICRKLVEAYDLDDWTVGDNALEDTVQMAREILAGIDEATDEL